MCCMILAPWSQIPQANQQQQPGCIALRDSKGSCKQKKHLTPSLNSCHILHQHHPATATLKLKRFLAVYSTTGPIVQIVNTSSFEKYLESFSSIIKCLSSQNCASYLNAKKNGRLGDTQIAYNPALSESSV